MITHSLVDPFHLIAKQNKGNPLWLHRIPFGQEVFFMPHTKRQGNAVFLCLPWVLQGVCPCPLSSVEVCGLLPLWLLPQRRVGKRRAESVGKRRGNETFQQA